MPKPESEKTPVTLVTGFLGAGKTTLLNHILKQKGSRHVAVIENEVGEINIDNSLVVENLLSKEDLVSMDRGCVCCSLRNDIVGALRELQGRASKRGIAYDAILLETTGLADPAPVAFTFFANSWISANYRLDSILCLVDAQHLRKHLEDAGGGDVNEAVNQIAFADIILLNKIDLVTPEELQAARDLVRSINVTADVIEVSLANCPCDDLEGHDQSGAKALPGAANPVEQPGWDRLMGINSFSIERALQVDPYFMDSDSESEDNASEGGSPSPSKQQPEAEQQQQQQQGSGLPAVSAEQVAANLAAPKGTKRGREEEGASPSGAAANGQLGECGTHPGPCNDACQSHEADEQQRKQKAAAQAAVAAAQRQPKRRRKKLHDLSGVGSVGITARGPLDKYRFNMFMRDLLGEKARDIFRSKGVLCIKGQEATKFVFQGVHETICFGPAATGWSAGEPPLNQIVFIGRDLNRRELAEGLRSCVWTPLPEGWSEHHDGHTNRPYYVNSATSAKQWERPETACALVQSTETSHKQPTTMQPRKNGTEAAEAPVVQA
jgi:G3E family GTPase